MANAPTITPRELIKYHDGEILIEFHGMSFTVIDVEFPVLAAAQHFTYAAHQDCWKDLITGVEKICQNLDGTCLYSIYIR